MKYETPEVLELTHAIVAVQNDKGGGDSDVIADASPAYEDWE